MPKHCTSCPIFTKQGIEGVNLGCLPDYASMKQMYNEGYIWACHDNENRACQGFVNYAEEYDRGFENTKVNQSLPKKTLNDW